MVKAVNPYLNFDGNATEAFEFYRGVFGGDYVQVLRYRDFPGGMGIEGPDLDRIAHIALPMGDGHVLMATDVAGSQADGFAVGSNVYITLEPDDAVEAVALFDGLSAGGTTEMPLQRTEWAELYGSCVDPFGVRWMVSYTGSVRFGEERPSPST
jgi:PhnB protein